MARSENLSRLYIVAVVSNLLALAILLYDVIGQEKRRAEVMAVVLTGVSVLSWLAYFVKGTHRPK